ncbi:MAG TPA: hypothetical protein VGF12_06980 [Roseateles sp.]|uniref:hypothetical protein n=1 Tax=Roseateles sp. TaxID=1971397 RepID=UPI002ED7C949
MQPESQRETVLRLCGGSEDASRLIFDAWRFAEVMDDAIDGEKQEPDADIYSAFTWALFDLHRNPFYLEHRSALELALRVAVAEWWAATRMEGSRDREQLVTAYTLRCSPYSFFVAVVLAAAGAKAADEAAHYFRSSPTPDRLDDYLREHSIGG